MLHRIINRIKRSKVLKFGFVGLIGTVINLIVFSIVNRKMGFNHNIASILAFLVAVINNYIINHVWTFKKENHLRGLNLNDFAYYVIGNIFGLLINLILLNVAIYLLKLRNIYISQLIGIFFSMSFNYFFSRYIVFSNLRNERKNNE